MRGEGRVRVCKADLGEVRETVWAFKDLKSGTRAVRLESARLETTVY